MNKKLLIALAIIFAIILIAVGVYYWLTPAGSLPSFFPGYNSPTAAYHHFKHGLAAVLLGLGSLIFAWFQSGKKSAK